MNNKKNYLIFFCHPNPVSLTSNIKDSLINLFIKNKINYKLIDLYNENFNPVLTSEDLKELKTTSKLNSVVKYQELITENRDLIFIFPLWWVHFPALLKGFVDKVFSFKFAYDVDQSGNIVKLLTKNTASFIVTMGNRIDSYKENGLYKSFKNVMNEGLFDFCGIKINNYFFIEGTTSLSYDKLKLQIDRIFKIDNWK